MRGLISQFFKKGGGQFRPQVGQPLELEWAEPGQKEAVLYGKISELRKKILVVQCPSSLISKIGPGAKLRVCSLSPPWFFSYMANVLGCEGSQLELSLPNQEQLENLPVPTFAEEEKLDFATSVDYQASRSPYKQAAEIIAVGRKGLTLQTNVNIPSQTSLELHLKLPNRNDPIPAQVKAVRSQNLVERKKFATEVEFVDFPESEREALWEIALRHHLRVKTRTSPG